MSASKIVIDVPAAAVPLALADLHRSLAVDTLVRIAIAPGAADAPAPARDSLIEGGGFAAASGPSRYRRLRTLPDYVGPEMRVLLVGLNPSLYSADAGVGFARPGNRFWPAMMAARLVDVAREPRRMLIEQRIGMTDLVKRATARADELDIAEYQHGYMRLHSLVTWLQPTVLCIVGLSGWRAAVDRRAVAGPQADSIGSTIVYVMPNTSGLNAHATIDSLADHFRAVNALAG